MVRPSGRPKDPIFWSHVKAIDAKKVKCNYCGKKFAKSVQRIRTHLTGDGRGVLPCDPNVIERVRREVAAGQHGNAGVDDNNNMNIDVMNPGTDMEAAYDGTQAMPEIVIQSNLDPVIQSTIRDSIGEDVFAVTTSRDAAMFLLVKMGSGADNNAAIRESTGEDVFAVTTSRDAAMFLQPIASQNVPAGEKLPATSSRDAAAPARPATSPNVPQVNWQSCMVDFNRTVNKEYVFGEATYAADPSHSDSVQLSRSYLNNPSGQTESSPKDPPVSSNFAAKSPSHESSPQDPPGSGADDNAATHESTGEDLFAVTTSRDAAEPAWVATVRHMPLYSNTSAFHFDGLPSYDRRHPPISSNFAAKSPFIHDEQVGRDPAAMLPSYEHEEEPADSRRGVVVSTSAASSFGNFVPKLHPPAAAALQNEEPADMEGCNSFSEHRIDAACEVLHINDCCSRFDTQVHQQAMQNPKKGVRLQDSSLASSSNDAETTAKRAVEKHVAAAFLRLLYCSSVPPVATDLVKDPLHMDFVETASEFGFPSSSVWGDSRFMKMTGSRIQGEVNEYIHRVKESWKTTGCTRVVFNLQLLPNHEDITTAFYCPKGVFFEPGNNAVEECYQQYVHALSHSNCIKHDNIEALLFDEEDGSFEAAEEYIGEDNLCELTDLTISEMQNRSNGRALCIQNNIQYWCIIICHRLEWADNLISIAGQIHTILCSSRQIQSWYYKMVRRERSSFKVLANNHCLRANRLAIFISILSIRNELSPECQLHSESYIKLARDKIRAITNGSTFWTEGRKLEVILKCVMKIGDVMDTFVPTAGYLGLALDKVDKHFAPDMGEGALLFWKKLRSGLELSYLEYGDNYACLDASYLNPVYYLEKLQTDSKAQKDLKERLNNKYDEEVDCYADECRKVPADYKLEQHHPVEVWEKYGKSLPNLRRFAIKALSRPLSCMCKEVKKYLYQLEGAENYILKLNVRMMQRFKLLGDDIYKPLELSPLDVV